MSIRTYHTSDPIAFSNNAAELAVNAYFVDLAQLHPAAEQFAFSVDMMNNAVAPGAAKSVTVHYAVTNRLMSPADSAPVSDQQSVMLNAAANGPSTLQVPFFDRRGRYLRIWFDHDALPVGAGFSAQIRVLHKLFP